MSGYGRFGRLSQSGSAGSARAATRSCGKDITSCRESNVGIFYTLAGACHDLAFNPLN